VFGNSLVADRSVASQGGLSSMELVYLYMERDGCCPCLPENNNAIVTKYRPISISVSKHMDENKYVVNGKLGGYREKSLIHITQWTMAVVQTLLFSKVKEIQAHRSI
jgi:hypothetical protein